MVTLRARWDGTRFVVGAAVVGGMALIISGLLTCPNPWNCVLILFEPQSWMNVSIWCLAPLVVVSVGAWGGWLCWLIGRTWLRLRRLPVAVRPPARLASAVARTGARRVRCLTTGLPVAFCAGLLRPVIVVSVGLVERLGDPELDAVLLHELDHAHRHEPLRRAAREAAARTLVYLPLLRWWSHHRRVASELRADRAALDRLGARPVARALIMLDSGPAVEAGVGFAGLADLRAAQILGDGVPRLRPPVWLIAVSLLGIPVAALSVGCLLQVARHTLG